MTRNSVKNWYLCQILKLFALSQFQVSLETKIFNLKIDVNKCLWKKLNLFCCNDFSDWVEAYIQFCEVTSNNEIDVLGM